MPVGADADADAGHTRVSELDPLKSPLPSPSKHD
jgi:hypothetical protein